MFQKVLYSSTRFPKVSEGFRMFQNVLEGSRKLYNDPKGSRMFQFRRYSFTIMIVESSTANCTIKLVQFSFKQVTISVNLF
jgi:hypothetical protein